MIKIQTVKIYFLLLFVESTNAYFQEWNFTPYLRFPKTLPVIPINSINFALS